MVVYDPVAAHRAVADAEARTQALIDAARGSGDPAAAALAVGAGLGELTGLAGGDGRLAPVQRWMAIQRAVKMRDALRRAVEQRQEVEHAMDETERTLKIAMFLMTLHYFRASVQIKQQRAVWQGSGDAELLASGPKIKRKTEERERMDAAAEARKKRIQAMAQADDMARKGWERIHGRQEVAAKRSREERSREERKRRARHAAAIRMQKTVRGFLERLRVFRWAESERLRKELEQRRAKASLDIQRVFRGYIGRQVAAEERKRVAAFVRWARKQEEKMALAEYYRNNTLKRWQKTAKQWWRNKQRAVATYARRTQRMTNVAETGLETEEERELEALGVERDERDADSDDSGLDDVAIEALGSDKAFFGAREPGDGPRLKSDPTNPAFKPSAQYARMMSLWEERRRTRDIRRAAREAAELDSGLEAESSRASVAGAGFAAAAAAAAATSAAGSFDLHDPPPSGRSAALSGPQDSSVDHHASLSTGRSAALSGPPDGSVDHHASLSTGRSAALSGAPDGSVDHHASLSTGRSAALARPQDGSAEHLSTWRSASRPLSQDRSASEELDEAAGVGDGRS